MKVSLICAEPDRCAPYDTWSLIRIVPGTNMDYGFTMNGSLAVKVRIRNSEGKYLAGNLANWGFSADPSKAMVFDYLRHQVAEQLEELRVTQGIHLEAVPVDPNELYETCDQCRRFVSAFGTFFDGSRFVCFDCLARNSVYAAPLVSKVEGGLSPVVQTKS